jgi:hypothetical protein
MFERVFGRTRTLAEWRWRFREAPAGRAYVQLLEVDGAPAGHMAHVPVATWIDGRRLVAGHGGDTMVLPEARGRGGMRQLVESFLAGDHGFDLRLNFPSDVAKPLFQRYGAGTLAGRLPLWVFRARLQRPLPAVARPPASALLAAGRLLAQRPAPRLAVGTLTELGAEVDELATASASFARCIRVRDAAYLRWRWLDQPGGHWTIRAARDSDGRLRGISVLGLDQGQRGLTGSIADLLARDAPALRALLVDASRVLVAAGAGAVTAKYLDPRPWARRVLLRSGYLAGAKEDFIARGLTAAAADVPDRAGAWYLTRGDTEPWPNMTGA